MYRWLVAGAIGQAAIAVTAAAVITVANETKILPGRAPPISLALIPMAFNMDCHHGHSCYLSFYTSTTVKQRAATAAGTDKP